MDKETTDLLFLICFVGLVIFLYKVKNKKETNTTGTFDYETEKQNVEERQNLIRRYETLNYLIDDIEISDGISKDIDIDISWTSNSGIKRKCNIKSDSYLKDFLKKEIENCTTSLSKH